MLISSLKSEGSDTNRSVVDIRKTLILPCDFKGLLRPILFALKNTYLTWNYSSDQNYKPSVSQEVECVKLETDPQGLKGVCKVHLCEDSFWSLRCVLMQCTGS